MSNTDRPEKQASPTLKKIVISGWVFLLAIFAITWYYGMTHQPTKAEELAYKETQKNELTQFKSNIELTTLQCDTTYMQAYDEVSKKNFTEAYLKYNEAEKACMATYVALPKIKLPDSLKYDYKTELNAILKNAEDAYSLKMSACGDFKKYIETKNMKYLSQARSFLSNVEKRYNLVELNLEKIKTDLN